MKISGHIIDILARRIFKGEVEFEHGVIVSVKEKDNVEDLYLLPGFIDAHVHIESSMLVPSEFARMAVVHGTVATISDPHEIGNVLGVGGVNYMIENGKQVPFKFHFGAPSCVPATGFETAGAAIGKEEVDALLRQPEIYYLAEMMNWPGVLFNDALVKEKIALAHKYNKPVDGHAPGLKGEQARQYAAAGITTDHECFTAEEALDKLKYGMKILIREGSAARNFEALYHLIDQYENEIMFCSDDKHPDSLEEGHINTLVKRALAGGMDLFKVLKAACINPIHHYKMNVGMLRVGDPADFIVINNPDQFDVLKTYVNGVLVAEDGMTKIERVNIPVVNNFSTNPKKATDFALHANDKSIRVIEALDGQLITNELVVDPKIENGFVVSDIEQDILKIIVVNRYHDAQPSTGFIKNFRLRSGAIASSVAHDSHNIIVVGVDDDAIAKAVNMIIQSKGGVAAVTEQNSMFVPLPVAGLMSVEDGYKVAQDYKSINKFAKDMGCTLRAPFMTLSFMALLVIPSLKLSDKGLFDGNTFQFKGVLV
ncbi:adenine deaminase [Chryseosolibacter indicus]|uniref:Adenine deaminase n=1 Tax=Chryseosolibacter indicus TaxID=2782351 RepID=A0ABS5VJX8_9BACT|nr:adenine deaminase [Chryseosolibacter indicus]MBT1701745.1 adenine deaminase [Chryseosolibacter indicus]